MGSHSTFDSLVSSLSTDQRRDLLDRIKRSAAVSTEPLNTPGSELGPPVDYKLKASELGLVARVVLFFRKLFSGKSAEELLSDDELKTIARSVDVRSPGFIDYRRGLLLEAFQEELKKLRDSARFFADVLARSFERDKGAFIAFLASVELPDIHARLLTETDASILADLSPEAEEPELRATVLAAYENILLSLHDERRKVMYRDLRSLLFLRRLSGFLFDRLIGNFKPGQSASGGAGASFAESRDLLFELSDILHSLDEAPSVELAEALFVFAAGEELGKPGFDAESTFAAQLAATEGALARIRGFNQRVPFVDILRLVSEDPGYRPKELPGGEDWFSLFKSFWKERIEEGLDAFKQKKKSLATLAEIRDFLGKTEPALLPHISAEGGAETPPVRLELALAFLDGFYRGPLLRELNRPLKLVLVDGEFYRKDNRIEFTDVYNELLRLSEIIHGFDARLAPGGDIGASYLQAKNELISLPIKRKKVQAVARNADEEAERIVKRAADAMKGMARIMRGILKGEAGGRYDSLQNLSFIDGKANKDFLKALDLVRQRCEKAHFLLKDISGLDLGSVD